MAFFTQKYTNYLLTKFANTDIGLDCELLYSEPNYFKYHINHFVKNKDVENKLVKKTTIIVLEVENFKILLNMKSKITNDSEYLGTFASKEVKIFADEFAGALIASLS